jgi:hypothetical protein
MSWVAVGVSVGAVQGAQQRKAQQDANQQQANISAAQTEFSPWTKIQPQAANLQPVTSSALGGAAQGALAGAMYSKANPSTPAAPASGGDMSDAGLMKSDPAAFEERRKMRGF